jgi:Protein of unknown function (DUF3237)
MTTLNTSFATRGLLHEPVPFEALPAEVSAEIPHNVSFTVLPAHPSNQLHIQRTSARCEHPPVRAWPYSHDPVTGAQRFQARLPPIAADQIVEYRPVLTRLGLTVAVLPARTARGVRKTPVSIAPDQGVSRKNAPRYQWTHEFLGVFTAQLAKSPESFGPAPDGQHITFYIQSGEIHGPKLNAKVRGEGGDWMLVRRDGVGVADVRITYETEDGALLLSRYYGIFDLGRDGYERALRKDYDPVPPLVVAPQFITSHPKWLWVNRLQCIGVGGVTMADLLVRFDLYAIRPGQPLPSSGVPRLRGTALAEYPRVNDGK